MVCVCLSPAQLVPSVHPPLKTPLLICVCRGHALFTVYPRSMRSWWVRWDTLCRDFENAYPYFFSALIAVVAPVLILTSIHLISGVFESFPPIISTTTKGMGWISAVSGIQASSRLTPSQEEEPQVTRPEIQILKRPFRNKCWPSTITFAIWLKFWFTSF